MKEQHITMESNRLKLVPISMEHQPSILAAVLESQAELAKFLSWVPVSLTEAESIESTQQAILNFENLEKELRFSIFEKVSSRFVGSIGLIIRDIKIPYFEIGYWIKSSCVSLGYATESVKLLETYTFNELKARRVEIKAAECNLKSRAVAERCGYLYEGTLRNDRKLLSGEISNTVIYAKTEL